MAPLFKPRLQTIDKLKDFICDETATIPVAMTRRMVQNFRLRFQEYIAIEDKHLDNIIFERK